MAEGGKQNSRSFRDIMQEQEQEQEHDESQGTSYQYPELTRLPDQHTHARHRSRHHQRHPPEEEQNYLPRGPFEESFDKARHLEVSRSTAKKRPSRLTLQQLNTLAQQTIRDISQNGEYVSIQLVQATMCQRIGVRDLIEIGYKYPQKDIPELQELQRLHAKVKKVFLNSNV